MSMCVSPVAPDDLRLTVSKATAIRHLQKRIQQGVALRRRRVRYAEDLEQARADKAAWVRAYTELLQQMFHGEAGGVLADSCNNGVGRIHPEYADTELFIEQFYDDMDYRLTCLRNVTRQVSELPEPSTAADGKVKPAPSEPRVEPPPQQPQPAPIPEKAEDAESAAAADPDVRAALSGLVVTHDASRAAVESVERFLRELQFDALTLPATPTPDDAPAINALETHPSAAFAVMVLGAKDSAHAVTFQIGYLVGRLGLSRVCVLHERGACGDDGLRLNLHGVHAVPLDAAGGWHLALARHFKRSGIEIDLNTLC